MRPKLLCGTSHEALSCYADAMTYRDFLVVQAALSGYLDGLRMPVTQAKFMFKRYVGD